MECSREISWNLPGNFLSWKAGEILAVAEPILTRNVHPTQIVAGYARALQTALETCDALAETIDVDNGPQLKKLVDAAVGTKFSFRFVHPGDFDPASPPLYAPPQIDEGII